MDFRKLHVAGAGKQRQARNLVWHEWGGSTANSLYTMST
jgi:hypothetical protein